MTSVVEGKTLPEIISNLALATTRGNARLADFRGHHLVLYFYPKDDTPGCTKESCDFRDVESQILRAGGAILGVSLVLKTPDTPWPMPQSLNDYLALAGGAGFALNNVMLRKLSFLPESDRMVAMFSGGTVMTALTSLVCMPLGLVTFPTDLAWWPYALGLALCMLGSNLSLQYGAARLPAHTTALVMLSEIVFATVSSVAWGVALLDGRKALGGLMIVSAAILATIESSDKEPI